jgi:hypothetical protein
MWVLYRRGLPERMAFPWKRPNGRMFLKGQASPVTISQVSLIDRLIVHILSKKPISKVRISTMSFEIALASG